jgi:hypothetical protein
MLHEVEVAQRCPKCKKEFLVRDFTNTLFKTGILRYDAARAAM